MSPSSGCIGIPYHSFQTERAKRDANLIFDNCYLSAWMDSSGDGRDKNRVEAGSYVLWRLR